VCSIAQPLERERAVAAGLNLLTSATSNTTGHVVWTDIPRTADFQLPWRHSWDTSPAGGVHGSLWLMAVYAANLKRDTPSRMLIAAWFSPSMA
jgi:hypothetical protein